MGLHDNGVNLTNSESGFGGSKNSKQLEAAADSPTFKTSWWGRRTQLEKGLLVVAILALVLATIMIVIVATRQGTSHTEEEDLQTTEGPKMCTTPVCIKTASRILEAMDSDIDPCEDFFEYACGSWNRKNVIPDYRSTYSTFSKLRDDLQVTVKSLLEDPIDESQPDAIHNAKHLYKSCLNTSAIEGRGDMPLRHLLDQFGGWPVLDPSWDEGQFDLIETMAKLRMLNNRILINFWVSSDDKNSEVNIIQIDQAQLGLPSWEYYISKEGPLIAYEEYAREVAVLMGADPNTAQEQMGDLVEFETKLANITTPDYQRRDTEAIYHKFILSDLYTNLSSYIDWNRYLNLVFANVSLTVEEDEPVVVYAPEYIKKLDELLRETPKRTVANYMVWRIVMNRIRNLPQKFVDLQTKFNQVLYGTTQDRVRWRTCVIYVNDNFGMAVGKMFIKDHFDERSKASALDMIHNIRTSFNELLDEVPWMDDNTRAAAKEKADAIREKIGYPDYILNDTALNMDYEGMFSDPEKFFENVLNNLNAVARRSLKNLREPVDRTRWSTTPVVVNAFYSAPKNQIMFPAGILQPPFYHEHYPKSFNFGGISMVIGHEITHGFDDRGRQFDKDGNLKEWWSPSVVEKFKEKAQCIIDQYSNYTVPEVDMNLNGRQTQGENIADSGGLKQAFRAYRTWVEEQGREEDPLPALDLSHNQLFFLNFAQMWCGSARPESYVQAIRSSRHSPGRFRVIGSLSNSYDFAKAFQCPVGSPMNPVNKCVVW